jgi:hemerythrin-like metal-binding protein
MPIVEWCSSYGVGVESIDNQHRQLCSLINELHDAMAHGKGRLVIGKALEELITYTKKHFGTEEALLQAHGYSDLQRHQTIHREFTAAVDEFQKEHRAGSLSLSVAMMDYLRRWLLSHILGTDKTSFAAVLEARATRRA